MGTLDLTLNGLKIPAIDNYTPPFGTKVVLTPENKGGLSTIEVNNNMIMPFALMRNHVVTKDSDTTIVEYDCKIEIMPSGGISSVTLTLGDGAYVGCTVWIKTNLGTRSIIIVDGVSYYSNESSSLYKFVWTGNKWQPLKLSNTFLAKENLNTEERKNSFCTAEQILYGLMNFNSPQGRSIASGKWLGRDYYREVVTSYDWTGSTATYTLNTGNPVADVELVKSLTGGFTCGGGTYKGMTFMFPATSGEQLCFDSNDGLIKIKSHNTSYNNISMVWAVIEYTKTN